MKFVRDERDLWGKPIGNRSAESYDGVGFALGCMMAGVLACLGIVAWQVFTWLKYGHWFPIGIADGLLMLRQSILGASEPLGGFAQWLTNPQSWLGIHKFLTAIPAALGALLLGIGLGLVLMPFERK